MALVGWELKKIELGGLARTACHEVPLRPIMSCQWQSWKGESLPIGQAMATNRSEWTLSFAPTACEMERSELI
jgi:hypothetical protein